MGCRLQPPPTPPLLLHCACLIVTVVESRAMNGRDLATLAEEHAPEKASKAATVLKAFENRTPALRRSLPETYGAAPEFEPEMARETEHADDVSRPHVPQSLLEAATMPLSAQDLTHATLHLAAQTSGRSEVGDERVPSDVRGWLALAQAADAAPVLAFACALRGVEAAVEASTGLSAPCDVLRERAYKAQRFGILSEAGARDWEGTLLRLRRVCLNSTVGLATLGDSTTPIALQDWHDLSWLRPVLFATNNIRPYYLFATNNIRPYLYRTVIL